MRRTLAALLLATLATAAPAQDAAAPSEELRAAAERYVASPAQQKVMDQMLSPEAIANQMRAGLPSMIGERITTEKFEQIVAIAAEELASLRPDMEAAMIDAAAATFTQEEIEALDAFYRTPEGAAVVEKMQPFMASFYEGVGPRMQMVQSAVMGRVLELMSD